MARRIRNRYVSLGADIAGATLASAMNPDGTDYTLPVSGTVTSTPATPAAPSAQQITATAVGVAFASAACKRVIVQNRLNDDANVAQAEDVTLNIGGVRSIQLTTGQSEAIATDNANRITAQTFANTAIVAAVIES